MRIPRVPRIPRFLRRAARALAALYVAASCAGCAVLNAAMFHPPRPPYGPDLPGLETIGPKDAPVAAVWSPVPDATRAVLFFYGNGEDLRYVRDRMRQFNRLGLSALAIDYPGYGRSPGRPTERSVYAAAVTAFRNLVEERGFAPSNIVVCGYSIGSGPACFLAERHDVGGLLLVSPFKSAVRVVTRVRILPFDPFPNIARVPRTRCPVLVLHGTADRVVPFSHGRAVAAAAGERGRFVPVPGADHVTVWTAAFADPDASAILRDFLAPPRAEGTRP
jgi:pimeloyl-ACP methyl ester carboxylesterase